MAAGLVVVALLGIGFALTDRDDEQGTVADDRDVPVETDDGAVTRLALADPAALGYEVRAAFDGPATEPEPGMEDLGERRYVAHGPSGAPDPWATAIVSMTVPVDEYTFIGELVDVGGPEASHVAVGPVDRVTWRDGAEHRHRHRHDEGFIIATRSGGSDVLQSLDALEPSPRTTTIDGREVLLGGSWRSATHAPWVLDDGTVAQLATYGHIDALLEEVVGASEPITQEELDELVAAHRSRRVRSSWTNRRLRSSPWAMAPRSPP